jgi:protein O-mannosyl-transferase
MTEKKKSNPKSVTYITYYVILAIISFAVYANSLRNDFVFDDESVVLGDPTITHLSSIIKYFTAQEGFHKVIGRYYRPVVNTSYAIDYALWDLKPFGFHLSNIIIHIINSLLFLKLLFLIFKGQQGKIGDKKYFLLVLLGGIIFAVNTIHTEAVSWVSGRTDSLAFTFFIASFISYLIYSKEKQAKYLILTIILYVFSLLAKEMSITFPVLVIIYDFYFNRELSVKEKILKNKLIYSILIIISIIYLIIRWIILKDVPERTTYFYFYGENSLTVFATMVQTIPLYFRLLFLPYGLLYHYNGYLPYLHSILDYQVIFSILFIVILISAIYLLRKKFPFTSFSILIVFTTLMPVMNIVPTMNFMAERFLYIPSIIVSIIILEFAVKYFDKKNENLIIGILVMVIAVYSYMTFQRNIDWKDNDTLFKSAEGKPGIVTYTNIGNIYANSGQYDQAEVLYRKALDISRKSVISNNNLGKIFLVKNNYDSASYYMYNAFLLDTLSPEPMFSMAQLNGKFQKLDTAIYWLERIQIATPGYMQSDKMLEQFKMQKIQSDLKPLEGSDFTKEQTLEIAKLEQESFQNYQSKKYTEAISQLLKLAELNPKGKAGYLNNAGTCYTELGDYKNAEKYLNLALKENPKFSTALNNLGQVHEKSGDKVKASEFYKKALTVDSLNSDARKNLERIGQ